MSWNPVDVLWVCHAGRGHHREAAFIKTIAKFQVVDGMLPGICRIDKHDMPGKDGMLDVDGRYVVIEVVISFQE